MADVGVSEVASEGTNLERKREHLRWKRRGAAAIPHFLERDRLEGLCEVQKSSGRSQIREVRVLIP